MLSSPAMRRAACCLVLAVLVLAPAAAGARRTIKLRLPRFTVAPGASVEACYFVRVPTTEPFDLGRWQIRNHGAGGGFATLHMLVYAYTGERLAEFAAVGRRVVPSRGCLDLGPADRDRRQLVASGALPRVRAQLPAGVAWRLSPSPAVPGGPPDGIGILLDANWANGTTRPRRASARVILQRAQPRSVRHLARALDERSAERALLVPPRTRRSTEASTAAEPGAHDAWTPVTDACVVSLTGHMHRRGQFLGVDHVDAAGTPMPPATGTANPFEPGRLHLFGAFDYTDPGVLSPPRPLLVRAGEALRYGCWIDNGVSTSVRLGCEESAGIPPGTAAALPGGGPAKPCSVAGPSPAECPVTDSDLPRRIFTGACVAANLVAGPTPDDETCALTGAYYDAPPGGGCD